MPLFNLPLKGRDINAYNKEVIRRGNINAYVKKVIRRGNINAYESIFKADDKREVIAEAIVVILIASVCSCWTNTAIFWLFFS